MYRVFYRSSVVVVDRCNVSIRHGRALPLCHLPLILLWLDFAMPLKKRTLELGYCSISTRLNYLIPKVFSFVIGNYKWIIMIWCYSICVHLKKCFYINILCDDTAESMNSRYTKYVIFINNSLTINNLKPSQGLYQYIVVELHHSSLFWVYHGMPCCAENFFNCVALCG